MAETRITKIPDDTWTAFRKRCLDEKVTINEKIISLIVAEVTSDENKKAK